MNIEIFSCSGGMAEGFRRAGIRFDLVVDRDPDACASYEANLGHQPWLIDARELLDRVELGLWCPGEVVDLLVADPPCTPWSRAGKRLGEQDERDMLAVTCRLIALLRPRTYLIGNVPGLQDRRAWKSVQRHIGGRATAGTATAWSISPIWTSPSLVALSAGSDRFGLGTSKSRACGGPNRLTGAYVAGK